MSYSLQNFQEGIIFFFENFKYIQNYINSSILMMDSNKIFIVYSQHNIYDNSNIIGNYKTIGMYTNDKILLDPKDNKNNDFIIPILKCHNGINWVQFDLQSINELCAKCSKKLSERHYYSDEYDYFLCKKCFNENKNNISDWEEMSDKYFDLKKINKYDIKYKIDYNFIKKYQENNTISYQLLFNNLN